LIEIHTYFILQRLSEISNSKKPTSTSQKPSLQKSILSTAVKRKSEPTSIAQPSALKCFAVLPGISDYKSSDENSSDSSDGYEQQLPRDLTGRQIKRSKNCDE
jgi:hypothetical protein